MRVVAFANLEASTCDGKETVACKGKKHRDLDTLFLPKLSPPKTGVSFGVTLQRSRFSEKCPN